MRVNDTVPARFPEDRPLDEDLGCWWVMHIKPNCEKKVAAYLRNRNISYYFPLYKEKRTIGYFRATKVIEVPLFRGYLCFALDKHEHNLLYDTGKFVKIIKVDDQEGFVKELSAVAKALETGNELIPRPGLVPGKKVIISSGPLEGAEGVILGRRHGRQLALSVRMFNQTVLVRLDALTSVEPA
jgi:transcription antitermination factor NusG